MRKRPRALSDIADWHSEMARHMYRLAMNAQTQGWQEAAYLSYLNHGYAAKLLRDMESTDVSDKD